jgi:hypothetical protein
MSWRDTIVDDKPEATPAAPGAPVAAKSWRDTIVEDKGPSTVSTMPSVAEAVARGAAQSATLGYADEGVGLFGAAVRKIAGSLSPGSEDSGKTFAQLYGAERDDSRKNFKKAEDARPVATLAGNLIGSSAMMAVAPGAGTVGAARAASMIGGAGKMASIARGVVGAGANSAILGAVEGSGRSDGKTAADIAKDTAGGGAAGGLFGGVLGGIVRLLPGTRGSVSNDLYRKVLGGTVGEDGAELASKYLKDPDARNQIVELTRKSTVDKIKNEVVAQVAHDVSTIKQQAGSISSSLLGSVDDQMAAQVATLRTEIAESFRPRAAAMNAKTGSNLRNLLTEIDQILTGDNSAALVGLGDDIGARLTSAPNAQTLRDVRDAVKTQLYTGGIPGPNNFRDGPSNTEKKVMIELYNRTQELFKAIPEASAADDVYSAAAQYATAAQKQLYRNGRPSAAAVESWILGKGTAGAVEDKDNIFALRDAASELLAQHGVNLNQLGKSTIATTRDVMEFNRLGVGELTGRSVAGIAGATLGAQLAGPDNSAQGATLGAFVMAAYNPRMYLRLLAAADKMDSDDRKVLKAILRAVKLQGAQETDDRL